MIIQAQIDIQVHPAAVMACYRDVAAWSEWDPDTREASIDGPFVVGTRGRLRPAKGYAVTMRLVEVAGHGFTVDAFAPLCTMHFEHVLLPIADGTRVTHRIAFSGLLAPVFARVVGGQAKKGLPVTLARLKQRLESGVATGTV